MTYQLLENKDKVQQIDNIEKKRKVSKHERSDLGITTNYTVVLLPYG